MPGIAAAVIMRAQQAYGFHFAMAQADNGPEFCRYFEQLLSSQNTRFRHSRLDRPNYNAHIERFNRTIIEVYLGNGIYSSEATASLQTEVTHYIEFYNTKRVHLGLELQTPVSMSQRS